MAKALPIVLGIAAIAVTGGAAIPGVAVALGTTAGVMSAIGVGLSIAGTLAATLLAETPPKPQMEEGDVAIKQAIPPRVRLYGRARMGGVYLYYDSTNQGDLKTLICHAAHEIDDSLPGAPNPEEHWLNDDRVEVNEDGEVTDDPWWQEASGLGDEAYSVVTILTYRGAPTQTIPPFADDWTPDHHAHGLNCTYVKYADLKDEDQIRVFPSGPPAYRVVERGAKVYDPREEGPGLDDQRIDDETTWKWSDNLALIILDYLTRTENGVPVGFGIKWPRINLASFETAADVCDQLIPLKAGGTEKRWRGWGAYELVENRKAVLQDLLDGCGGRLTQGPNGAIGLSVGGGPYRVLEADPFTVPGGVPVAAVTLDEDQLFGWEMTNGKTALERVNEVRATYVSQAWEWAEAEAGIQKDDDGIDRNGVESSQVKLRFVPAESQAQRCARETLRRGNPTWIGTVRTTLAGLDAWGERWIHLQIAELEIDQIFEIVTMRLDRETMMVEIEVASYDDWWTWTATEDEQDPAIPPPDTDDDGDIPIPDNVTVEIEHRLVNGQTYVAIGVVRWDAPPRPVYVARARFRPVLLPEAPWQPLPVAQDDLQVETGALIDGQLYEAQVRFIGSAGGGGNWSSSATFTAVADPVAPPLPTGLTAQVDLPAVGLITITATAPNSPKHASLRFYRNTSNTFVGATLVAGPLYGAPGQARSYVDNPGVGDWYYFATSANWSDIESDPVGGVLAEVAPAAPVITSPSGPISTYDKRPPISGDSATAGASIKLYANAVQVGSDTADGSGNWSVTPSTDLGTGANSMTATQTVAGNESVASGSVAVTVAPLDTDAAAYIAAMAVTPSTLRQALLSTLIADLKTDGVWSLLDGLYLMAAHDEQAARINAKAPASVATATGAPTFTVDRGFEGNVASDIDTGINPLSAGGNYSQNSLFLAVYGTSAVAGSAQPPVAIGTTGTASGAYINPRGTTDQQAGRANDAAGLATANTDTIGFFSVRRSLASGAGAKQLDEEGVQVATATTASTTITNATVRILHGTGTAVSAIRVGAAAFGGYPDNTKLLALRNRLHAYLQAIGAV